MSITRSSLVKTASSHSICLFCRHGIRTYVPYGLPHTSRRYLAGSSAPLQRASSTFKNRSQPHQTDQARDSASLWEDLPQRPPNQPNTSKSLGDNKPDNFLSGQQYGKEQRISKSRPPQNGSIRNSRRNDANTQPNHVSNTDPDFLPQDGYDDGLEQYAEDKKPRRGGLSPRKPAKQTRKSQKFSLDDDDKNHGYGQQAARRRPKDKKDRKASRREEKFASDEEDFLELKERADDEAFRLARKEERKQRQREREEAARALQSKQIELPAYINLANLATLLKARFEPFVEKLKELGFTELGKEHFISYEDASLIAMEYGFSTNTARGETEDLKPRPEPTDTSALPPRPPVVTIMGHVDHGKTTILDYLRKSSVVAQEHGGITQHIGAFSVPMASGKTITFLDTPGHAAFLSMRQRGANVTDIVILVVAADDSVKPQTIEAIKHAKAANVPIIVAINKVDKEDADIERVKQDLMRYDITVEDYSGDVQAYPVSGLTGQGIADLVEGIDTQAEIQDMRAERTGPVEGWVLEAATRKAGRMATVLIRRGTLRSGNVLVAGTTWARVRTLKNEAGALVSEAPPGHPVEIDGWRDQPTAGDEVLQAPSEQKASAVVHLRETQIDQVQAAKDMEQIQETRKAEAERHAREKEEKQRQKLAKKTGIPVVQDATPEQDDGVVRATAKPAKAAPQTLYFLVKADVSGSAEAIEGAITALPLANHPVSIALLRSAVGQVSESDVDHAASAPPGQAFILSFNQPTAPAIAADAARRGVALLQENIIYKVIDAVRLAVEARLPPVVSRRVLGDAETLQAFDINVKKREFMRVAGCKVRNGVVSKGAKVRVFRGGSPSINSDDHLVYEGSISSLKSHKKDVPEMRQGTECGISFDKWEDFKAGDTIQCYEERSEPRRLT